MDGFHGCYWRFDLGSGDGERVDRLHGDARSAALSLETENRAALRRFLTEELTEGASAGGRLSPERLQEMIRSYNLARGWTEQGHLPEAVMRDLALGPSRTDAASARPQVDP